MGIPTRLGVLLSSSIILLVSVINAWASISLIRSNINEPNNWPSNYNTKLASFWRAVPFIGVTLAIASSIGALAGLFEAGIHQKKLVGVFNFPFWGLLLVAVGSCSVPIWSAYREKGQFELLQAACCVSVGQQ